MVRSVMVRTNRIAAVVAIVAISASALVATSPAVANSYNPNFHSPVAVGDTVYFSARTTARGNELWATDSATGAPRLVKDIYPGTRSSLIGEATQQNHPQFTALGAETFFLARDSSGLGLWKTDGTAAGTVMVTPRGVIPRSPVEFNGSIYFAAHQKDNGYELWKTDGTPLGTSRVVDLRPGSGDGNPTNLTVVDDRLFFVGSSSSSVRSLFTVDLAGAVTAGPVVATSGGAQTLNASASGDGTLVYTQSAALWESDGTVEGTHKLVADTVRRSVVVFDGDIYYEETTEAGHRLMKYTDAGVQVISTQKITGVAVVGGRLWFGGIDRGSTTVGSVWTIEASGATPVKLADLSDGLNILWRFTPTFADGQLYFEALGYLWVSDGSAAGTHTIKNLGFKANRSKYVEIAATGSMVVVATLDSVSFDALWISDGTTAGTFRQFPLRSFTTAPIPKIAGSAVEGETLTASTAAWLPNPAALTYKWKVNGVPIVGATSSTLVVPEVAAGSKITAVVTATRDGFTTAAKTSLAKTVIKAFAVAPTPTISGTIAAGSVLTAGPGTWSPAAKLSYAWFADGKAIFKGPKTNTYTLTATSQFKSVTVRVTATKAGYATTARTSAPAQ